MLYVRCAVDTGSGLSTQLKLRGFYLPLANGLANLKIVRFES